MEHINILNRIIEAEHKAQEIANEAKKKREDLPSNLKVEREKMLSSYMERAEKRLKAVRDQEEIIAAERIGELDAQLAADIENFKKLTDTKHNEWVSKLFESIVYI